MVMVMGIGLNSKEPAAVRLCDAPARGAQRPVPAGYKCRRVSIVYYSQANRSSARPDH
jgi:hypothetical protein